MRGTSKRSVALLACIACLGATAASAAAKTGSPPVDLSNADHCDFIGQQQGSLCLLPFPDDYYTIADPSTATGRRINLKTEATQPNSAGQRVDTAPYNLNDGYSPGQTIVVKVPGLNSVAAMQRTGAVPINHIGQYASPDQPIVVIDATTGQRWPIWSEIDSNATDPDRVALLIHPAVDFAAKDRYIVALRDLKTADGVTIPAPNGFRYYRDKLRSDSPVINERRKHFESIFKTLQKAHIKRKDLYLAWDFTVASDQNIAGRMLHIRNDAFAQLGDTDLADGVVQGQRPRIQRHERAELQLRAEPGHRPRGPGHVHGALLSHPELRSGRHLPVRFERAAAPATATGARTSTA